MHSSNLKALSNGASSPHLRCDIKSRIRGLSWPRESRHPKSRPWCRPIANKSILQLRHHQAHPQLHRTSYDTDPAALFTSLFASSDDQERAPDLAILAVYAGRSSKATQSNCILTVQHKQYHAQQLNVLAGAWWREVKLVLGVLGRKETEVRRSLCCRHKPESSAPGWGRALPGSWGYLWVTALRRPYPDRLQRNRTSSPRYLPAGKVRLGGLFPAEAISHWTTALEGEVNYQH